MGCILSIILLFVFLWFNNFLMEILGDSLGCIVRCSCMMAFSIYSEKKFREKMNQKLLEESNKESMEKYKGLLKEKEIYECPNCGEKFEDNKYTLGVKCPNCKKLFIAENGIIYFDEEINTEILENYIYAISGGIGWFSTYLHYYDKFGRDIFLSLYATINKRNTNVFREKIFKSKLIEEIFEFGFRRAGTDAFKSEKNFLCIRNTMKFFDKKEHKEIIKTIISSIMLMSAYNYERYIHNEEEEKKFDRGLFLIKGHMQECLFGTENAIKMSKILKESINDEDFILMILSGMMLGLTDREREESYTKENNEDENKVYSNKNKYYNILNLNESATMEEVKKSYRKLVKMYHPDKYISKNISEEEMKKVELKFIEIQEAYEKIKDLRNE